MAATPSARPADEWIGFVKAYRETVGGLTYAQALALASKEWKKPEVKNNWIKFGQYILPDGDIEQTTLPEVPQVLSSRKPRQSAVKSDFAMTGEHEEYEAEPAVDLRSLPVRSHPNHNQNPHQNVRNSTTLVEPRPSRSRNYQEKYYQLKMRMTALGLDDHDNLPDR